MTLLDVRQVWKEFTQPNETVIALQDINLAVEPGQFLFVTGESGSGKTTLLSLLGALDRPTRGSICFQGEPMEQASSKDLAAFRLRHMGFVFQDFLLVRHLTAFDNVKLPIVFSGGNDADRRASKLLEQVNLTHRKRHRPDALSRGEMQRVALARALANGPKILLADEPTANLDKKNSKMIWDLLIELNRTARLTVIVATHNRELAQIAGEAVRLDDGRLVAYD